MHALKIVAQSAHAVVVDKPAGWLTVPGRTGTEDPRSVLGHRVQEVLGARVWPVHRLDVDVSGLVLFALDAEAHRFASAAFEGRTVQKVYEALTEGAPPPGDGSRPFTWESRIVRGKKRSFEAPHGKLATTRATYLGQRPQPDGPACHFRLEPVTGRPHQLRVHLRGAGWPILGDRLYGAHRPFQRGIALKAVALTFVSAGGEGFLGLPPSIAVAGWAAPSHAAD